MAAKPDQVPGGHPGFQLYSYQNVRRTDEFDSFAPLEQRRSPPGLLTWRAALSNPNLESYMLFFIKGKNFCRASARAYLPLEYVSLLHFLETIFFPRLNLSFEYVLHFNKTSYLFSLDKVYLWNMFSIAEIVALRFPCPLPLIVPWKIKI